ncbi:putative phenylacetate-CoA oxygenase, PaaJ subunit [Ostertagia ostertagi]
MATATIDKKMLFTYLDEIKDPEVPALSIIDLGIVRDIIMHRDEVEVVITPTYTGCPAMDMIAMNIRFMLTTLGFKKHKVTTILSPAWTTDWMTEEGKRKLKDFGIAPPNPVQQIIDHIGLITLNRPEKLNAFNREMSLLLQQKLDECAAKEVRCVLITGAGKGFSAGQDLAEVTQPGAAGFNVILSEYYNPIVTRIRKLEKPVVAAVNGVAAGAGANIALCCDIVVAAESASFIQAFSRIGMAIPCALFFLLAQKANAQQASASPKSIFKSFEVDRFLIVAILKPGQLCLVALLVIHLHFVYCVSGQGNIGQVLALIIVTDGEEQFTVMVADMRYQ